MRIRAGRCGLPFLILLACHSALGAQQAPDTAGWLRDFEQLKSELAAHYANLEWAVSERRLDLRQLASATENAIRLARSDAAARTALQNFVNAFGDGHFEIRFPAASSSSSPPQTDPVAGVCARQRYIQRAPRIRIPFDRLPQFRRIDNEDARYFPLGILELANQRRVAVLRIASFEDNVFLDLCERAATQLSIAADSNCAARCAGPLNRETSNLMTDAIVRQIKVAQSQDISALIVDLTHNGGGTNWVEAAARVLTPVGLKAPRAAFLRHPHHATQLRDKIDALRADLRAAPTALRAVLRAAIDTLERARTQAGMTCDRRPLWEGKPIACSALVREPALYASGVLAYAKASEIATLSNCCALFYPARYRFQEGVYRGPLYVLIDRETASAAEYFAALLKDNGAALLIGEVTYGAGCGYTNGGIPTTLRFSGARVLMPDCVRYRADGSNEVDGITPDFLVPWRARDSEFQRAQKTLQVLNTVIR
jgi:hypothetical protein